MVQDNFLVRPALNRHGFRLFMPQTGSSKNAIWSGTTKEAVASRSKVLERKEPKSMKRHCNYLILHDSLSKKLELVTEEAPNLTGSQILTAKKKNPFSMLSIAKEQEGEKKKRENKESSLKKAIRRILLGKEDDREEELDETVRCSSFNSFDGNSSSSTFSTVRCSSFNSFEGNSSSSTFSLQGGDLCDGEDIIDCTAKNVPQAQKDKEHDGISVHKKEQTKSQHDIVKPKPSHVSEKRGILVASRGGGAGAFSNKSRSDSPKTKAGCSHKNKVSFGAKVHYRVIPSRNKLRSAERKTIWWQKKDYKIIMKNLEDDLQQMKEDDWWDGRPSLGIHEASPLSASLFSYCSRGLEDHTHIRYLRKRMARSDAIGKVLDEQYRQQEQYGGLVDEDLLGKLYSDATSSSQMFAQVVGLNDEKFAQSAWDDL